MERGVGKAGRKYAVVVFLFQELPFAMAQPHLNPAQPWEASGELNPTGVAAPEN